jgi:D-threonate/D-erythronate kinase
VDVLTTDRLRTTSPGAAAADLAERVAAAVAGHRYGALVAVGGDGAAAILRRLSADHVTVDGAISGGCPTGVVSGGTADGLRLVTKSGGFGDPTTLSTLVRRLRSGTGTHHVPHPLPPSGGPPDRTAP